MKNIVHWIRPDCNYCRGKRQAALLMILGVIVEILGFAVASELRYQPWNSLIAAVVTVLTIQLCWPLIRFNLRDKGHP